jgi:hypothetical protein
MKIKSITVMLIVFGAFFNTTTVFAQFGTKTAKVAKFDKSKFVSGVKSNFDGKVKGYQVILLKNGQIAAEYADGDARTPTDGQADMTVNTPANIGSAAKFFGGTALLKLFSSPKASKANPTGKSVDEWLDTRIFAYLPKVWQDYAHSSWREVTFGQLLMHKSGVRGFTKEELAAFAEEGGEARPHHYFPKELKVGNRGVRDYENFNITILTFLIPVIADPNLLTQLNAEVEEKKLRPSDLYITQRLGDRFEKHIHGAVFEKITPKIYPSCDAPNYYPTKSKIHALAYNSIKDTTKGFEWSEKVGHGSCFAQGGWYITGRELAAYVANFAATENIVTNAVRTQMFDDDKDDNRLVWSRSFSDQWVTDNFDMKVMPFMGGTHNGSRASILMLPNGYYAVGIINSGDMTSGEVTIALLNAFKSSITF